MAGHAPFAVTKFDSANSAARLPFLLVRFWPVSQLPWKASNECADCVLGMAICLLSSGTIVLRDLRCIFNSVFNACCAAMVTGHATHTTARLQQPLLWYTSGVHRCRLAGQMISWCGKDAARPCCCAWHTSSNLIDDTCICILYCAIPAGQPGTHGVSLTPVQRRLAQVPASQLPVGRHETCQVSRCKYLTHDTCAL